MAKIINVAVRLVLTALLVAWAAWPYVNHAANESLLSEISKIGLVPGILLVAGFFIMVAFYCRTLEKCLTLVKPENRKAAPKSVWYMFAIPFNFVEDFFIVIAIANALAAEKKTNVRLSKVTDLGMVSGIGWSIAQILSFIPNSIGQIAGIIGMLLVIYHWVHIAKINKLLAGR